MTDFCQLPVASCNLLLVWILNGACGQRSVLIGFSKHGSLLEDDAFRPRAADRGVPAASVCAARVIKKQRLIARIQPGGGEPGTAALGPE